MKRGSKFTVLRMSNLDLDILRRFVTYDPESGHLWRKTATGSLRLLNKTSPEDGYISFSVAYQSLKGHRVAWALFHGTWAEGLLDHINGDRVDNRIENLRVVSASENSQNRQRANRRRIVDLPLGVYPRGRKFESRIRIAGKNHFLGVFETVTEAAQKYLEFRRMYMKGNTL